jgi:PAS domain S-box-containing protein
MMDPSDILNCKILIAADAEADARVLKQMLGAGGYTSIAVTAVSQAVLKRQRRHRYDLVILDLRAGSGDEITIIDALQKLDLDGGLPVLAIVSAPDHKKCALQAGAKDCIGHPFDEAEILMRAHNLLEARLLQIEAKNYGEFLEQMIDERTAILREREELFRQAVEACPSAMIMTDQARKMVMVNTEAERLFGYRRDELLGQPIDMLVPSALRERHAQHCSNFALHPQARRIGTGRDLSGTRKDGSEIPVEIGLYPIQTSEGLLVLGVIIDITERKRVERLKDEFVSMVSHELRTPLTSISGSLGLLLGAGTEQSHEPMHRLLTIAQRNCERLIRLLNDILDIEKMESGKLIFNFERTAVLALVEQAIEGIRNFAENHGVRLHLAADTDAEVEADPLRLLQVMTNLLSNAIKFSPAGEDVIVTVEKDAAAVRIAVRDRGPGIPEEFKARIFQKFAQADAAEGHQKGGSGLGLSIVRQIVDRLSGEIFFENAPGGGTIFCVTLPTGDGMAADAEPNGAQGCENRSRSAAARS